MFAAAIWKFGVMKTKQCARNVEPNGNVPTSQPHASNTASTLRNAEALSNHEKPEYGGD